MPPAALDAAAVSLRTAAAAGLEGIDSRGEEEEALCCVLLLWLDWILSNQGRSVQHIAMAHQGWCAIATQKCPPPLPYQWRTFARCSIAI